MIEQTVKIKSPIKVKPSENYLLVIEDADGVTHYWHKEHISVIEGEEVKFESGQYDGWSREMKQEDCDVTKELQP